jgi:cell division protein FtsB
MNFKIVSSKRGSPNLLLNGYKYREARRMVDGNYSYRCTINLCTASLKLDKTKNNIIELKEIHNHKAPVNEEISLSSQSSSSGQREIQTSTEPTISDILRQNETGEPVLCSSIASSTPIRQSSGLTQNFRLSELEAENVTLKERIKDLREQWEAAINRSMECDIRLMQLMDKTFSEASTQTEDVFCQTNNSTVLRIVDEVTELQTPGMFADEILVLQSRNQLLSKEITSMKISIEVLEADNYALRTENMECRAKISELNDFHNNARAPCSFSNENTCKSFSAKSKKPGSGSKKQAHVAFKLSASKSVNQMDRETLNDFSIQLSNRFLPLENCSDNTDLTEDLSQQPFGSNNIKRKISEEIVGENGARKLKSTESRSVRGDKTLRKKVLLLSDSHGRGINNFLSKSITEDFFVCGNVYPGAKLDQIMENTLTKKELSALTKNDYAVIIGGTNNFDRKSTVRDADLFLEKLKNLIKEFNKKTNFIVSTVPYRYDLSHWSVENILIKQHNVDIRKLCREEGCMVVEFWSVPRRFHTNHGLHLNNQGKRQVALRISNLIRELENKQSSINLTGFKDCESIDLSSDVCGGEEFITIDEWVDLDAEDDETGSSSTVDSLTNNFL